MKLIAYQSNDHQPRRIHAPRGGEDIALIYCDTEIKWLTDEPLPLRIVQDVAEVALNFRLFYDNLGGQPEPKKSSIQ